MLFQFGNVLFGILFGGAFVALNVLVASRLLAPRVEDAAKRTTYECGEPAIGPAWIRFDMRFYVTALVFLIFDVEVVFLFPWAVVYNAMVVAGGLFAFFEVAIFVAILGVGLVYVWAKGDLDWVKASDAQRAPRAGPEGSPMTSGGPP